MTSRERVRCAINLKKPDRTPVDLGTTNVTTLHVTAYENLLKKLGIKDEKIRLIDFPKQLVIPCEEFMQKLEIDTRPVKLGGSKTSNAKFISQNEYIDDWGIKWRRPEKGLYYDSVSSPLKDLSTLEEIEKYPWPLVENLSSSEGLKDTAKSLYENTNYSLVGSFGSSIFMMAQIVRGYEQFFIDMMIDEDIACYILDKVLEIRLGMAKAFLDAAGEYLDVVEIADDLAGQDGPLMSLEIYRKFIKPRSKKLIDFIKRNSCAKVMYHCCGAMSDFVDDLIEIGVDILNPIQVSAANMDTKVLKEKYGDKLAFWGGIDGQDVLPNGSPEDVARETEKRVRELGLNGGYVMCASHNIQADVSAENIISMLDSARSIRL